MADKNEEKTLEASTEETKKIAPVSDEEQLLKAVQDGDRSKVARLASLWNITIDHVDKNGMTALMHAAYKGDVESVEILLTQGADVNRKSSEHAYTPLMFATLAGSKETAQILLEAGADPNIKNKINKTATQMGAFVGRHECVSLINNYVGKQEIEYYTKPQGLETEPKLAQFLAEPLQNFIILANLNPVFICLFLEHNVALVENAKQVARILDIKRDRLFKLEVNEIMAMKIHYFACIHNRCAKWHETEDGIFAFIKKLITGRAKDGFPDFMEDFIRDSIRSFPFRESNLFKQLIRTLAPVQKGNEPTALSALTQSINGLQSANFATSCYTCGKRESTKKCANCRMARYCSQDCQKMHWFTHKKHCKQLAKQYEREQEMEKELARQQKEAEAAAENEAKKKEVDENKTETIDAEKVNGETTDETAEKEETTQEEEHVDGESIGGKNTPNELASDLFNLEIQSPK